MSPCSCVGRHRPLCPWSWGVTPRPDILDRVFGPDPNPGGPPVLTGYGALTNHVHQWTPLYDNAGPYAVTYWECTTNRAVCQAVATHRP